MSPDLDTLLDASELPDHLPWQSGDVNVATTQAAMLARGTRIVCGCCQRTVLVTDTMDGTCLGCTTGGYTGPEHEIPTFGGAMPRGVPALRESGVWNAISGEVVR